MQRAVARFPFMTGPQFIAAVEQVIQQQVPPDLKPAFEERLATLRKMANEVK
jgi:hypothetical protein